MRPLPPGRPSAAGVRALGHRDSVGERGRAAQGAIAARGFEVGSAFAGMTRRVGDKGDGACARSWRYRAEWIPAYAEMTERYAPRPQCPLLSLRGVLSRDRRPLHNPPPQSRGAPIHS